MMSVESRSRSRPGTSLDFSVSLPDSGSVEGELRGLSAWLNGGDGLALSSVDKAALSLFGDRSVFSFEEDDPALWAAKMDRPNSPL